MKRNTKSARIDMCVYPEFKKEAQELADKIANGNLTHLYEILVHEHTTGYKGGLHYIDTDEKSLYPKSVIFCESALSQAEILKNFNELNTDFPVMLTDKSFYNFYETDSTRTLKPIIDKLGMEIAHQRANDWQDENALQYYIKGIEHAIKVIKGGENE